MKKILALITIAILVTSSSVVLAKETNSPIIRKSISTITTEDGEKFTGEIITYKPYYGEIVKTEKQKILDKVIYEIGRSNIKPMKAPKREFFMYILPESTGSSYNIDQWKYGLHFVGTIYQQQWVKSQNGVNYYQYSGWIMGYDPDEIQPYFDKVTK